MNTPETELVVPQRFRGPASSGNGGWTAGALAERAGHWTTTVQLRRPPPLEVMMSVATEDEWTLASLDSTVIARACAAETEPDPVAPVTADLARTAETAYPGHHSHPFPTCFACGTRREEGDGLRIFPGPAGDGVAATWTPHQSVAADWHAYADPDGTRHASLPVTWAALDCVGGWAGDLTERLMVLGTMTARVDALPAIGELHVLVGARRSAEGRKTLTSATLYDAAGRLVACAEHIWITVDPKDFS
ncbi:MAG: hypothetical protein WKF79_02955 [Nocardioides sp.]